MTFKELEEYLNILASIRIIQKQIQTHDETLLKGKGDGVRSGSIPNPTRDHAMRKLALLEQLDLKREEQAERLEEILEWVNSIESLEIQNIVRCRYLLGYTWKRTAKECYGYASDKTPYYVLKKYLDEEN